VKYDADGDGTLDAAEQAMHDMDTENHGHLSNEKVYKVMLEQMKLQKEVFGLKWILRILAFITAILSLVMLRHEVCYGDAHQGYQRRRWQSRGEGGWQFGGQEIPWIFRPCHGSYGLRPSAAPSHARL
jgi:hypothetical protein